MFINRLMLLLLIVCSVNFASIEHKGDAREQYLSHISDHQDEKAQLIQYIKGNPNGVFMDIGTGGDTIAHTFRNIPQGGQSVLIAADLDSKILDTISIRNPDIAEFVNRQEKPYIKTMRLDATHMPSLKESSLDGINASAIVHEIFSYGVTKDSLDQFFLEIVRVMKKDAVFIYRDPQWVDEPFAQLVFEAKEKIFKYFITLFSARFLDREFSHMRTYHGTCSKPELYKNVPINFIIRIKGCDAPKVLSFKEFLDFPTAHIDFDKEFFVEAPNGFISEIVRHYVLYLKDINIVGLIDKNLFKKTGFEIDDVDYRARSTFVSLVHHLNIPLEDNKITASFYEAILKSGYLLESLIANGHSAKIKEGENQADIIQALRDRGISDKMIRKGLDDSTIWFDAKILAILFQGENSGLAQYFDFNWKLLPFDTLSWLKREGEEFYFYKTIDELLVYIGQLTWFGLTGTDKDGCILCPISFDALASVSRKLYQDILNRDAQLSDWDGIKHEFTTQKSVIHFGLRPAKEAFELYEEIIKYNPQKFKNLAKWMQNEQKRVDKYCF